MVQNKDYLLKQKGKPPIGRCLDCKRDILAMEIAATCPNCENQMVCYKCVDKHDHLHVFQPDLRSPMGLSLVSPNVRDMVN